MKIKRIICLILCLVMSVLVLASCEEDVISEAQAEKDKLTYKPDELDKAELNLYIITEGAINNSTTISVERSINQYLESRVGRKFDTKLNIIYFNIDTCESSEKDKDGKLLKYGDLLEKSDYDTVTEYRNAVYGEFLKGREDGIVLITSEEMLDGYIANNQLVDMNPYFENEDLIKKYDYANIAASLYKTNKLLLDFAKEGEDKDAKLYFLPNNRVMGTYDYLIVDKRALPVLEITEPAFRATSWDDAKIREIKDELLLNIDAIQKIDPDFEASDIDSMIRVESLKNYEDRFGYEDDGFICCVVNPPKMDRSELAESGFAILKDSDFDPTMDLSDVKDPEVLKQYKEYQIYEAAAMEIIYLINCDVEMRNLLLYGKEGVNYKLVDGVVIPQAKEKAENYYKMSLEYTGDIFLAYHWGKSAESDYEKLKVWYEGRDEWTAEIEDYGLNQNKECVGK